jgi:aspartate kinase
VPKLKIGGMMQSAHLAKLGILSVPDKPGVAGAALNALGRVGINVQFIVQCIDNQEHTQIVCCVSGEDGERALRTLEGIKAEFGAQEIALTPDVAIVSIFGPDFREIPGISGTMFSSLASVGINILAISTSISTISCVISARDLAQAARVLAGAFEFP